MIDPDEVARCAAARRARREALHCGGCGRPFVSQIGAPECDCPPIKLRTNELSAAGEASAAAAVEYILTIYGSEVAQPTPDDPPPSGWRDRPSLL